MLSYMLTTWVPSAVYLCNNLAHVGIQCFCSSNKVHS